MQTRRPVTAPLGRLLAGRPELIALLAATLAASAPQPVKQDPDHGTPFEKNRAADTADMAEDPRAAAVNRQMRARRGRMSAATEARPALPVPAGVPAVPAAAPSPSSVEFEAAERRAAEMTTIARQAERWGVGFDLPAALKSRMSCAEARRQVQEARAAADEALPTVVTPTVATAKASSVADSWDRATARAAERAGMKTGTVR